MNPARNIVDSEGIIVVNELYKRQLKMYDKESYDYLGYQECFNQEICGKYSIGLRK